MFGTVDTREIHSLHYYDYLFVAQQPNLGVGRPIV